MATAKAGTKRPTKKRKKAKKQTVLSVVSVRISDKEKDFIDNLKRAGVISRYSDVLRLALQMMQVPANDENEYTENSGQNYHATDGDIALSLQAVCRNNDAVQSQLRHVCQTGCQL